MKFSLILATINRVEETDFFLASLDAQTYRDFELIVVDQNTDDSLKQTISKYTNRFHIRHLYSDPGLSHARNVGLEHISGDIIAFPDDDCAYPKSLLQSVASFFDENEKWNGLTGKSISQKGRDTGNHRSSTSGKINRYNVWRRGISYTIFLKRHVVDKVGKFDETLGVGAGTAWGSAEETDYLLRAIDLNLYFDSDIKVVHPVRCNSKPLLTHFGHRKSHFKTYAYAMGRGRVLRKHNTHLWFVLYGWVRPLLGIAVSLLRLNLGRADSYWATLRGRVKGYFSHV